MTETTTHGTAIERRPVELGKPVLDLDSAFRLSKNLALAALMPDSLRGKPQDVLAVMLYGQDLGLSPMQAIQAIYVVKGKPQLAAQTWIALARRAGHNPYVACKNCAEPSEAHRANSGHRYEADHDATRCTFTVVRGDTGAKHTETFTWADAERAKLAGKDVWKSYPKRMLLARAASDCCRVVCPEIALGFYAEGDDFADDIDAPIHAQPTVEAERDAGNDVVDGEIVEPDQAAEQVAQMAAQFDFTTPAASDDGQGDPPPAPDYVCETCGTHGEHFEDECPNSSAVRL